MPLQVVKRVQDTASESTLEFWWGSDVEETGLGERLEVVAGDS